MTLFPCDQCGLPILQANNTNNNCQSCINTPPPYQTSLSPFQYSYPIDKLISDFKYHGKLQSGKLLAQLLSQYIQCQYQHKPLPDLIIPVPLHTTKIRQRGFNQANELARYLSKSLTIPMDNKLCLRIRDTVAQRDLSSSQRKNNLHNAFYINPARINRLSSIAVVDDVITTMSTATEISKLLLYNGALNVHIWSIARTYRDIPSVKLN